MKAHTDIVGDRQVEWDSFTPLLIWWGGGRCYPFLGKMSCLKNLERYSGLGQ